MIHLIKSGTGKKCYAAVLARNGNLVWQTPKNEYKNKTGVYNAIRSIMREVKSGGFHFQDDTYDKPKCFYLEMKGQPLEIFGGKTKCKYEGKKKR